MSTNSFNARPPMPRRTLQSRDCPTVRRTLHGLRAAAPATASHNKGKLRFLFLRAKGLNLNTSALTKIDLRLTCIKIPISSGLRLRATTRRISDFWMTARAAISTLARSKRISVLIRSAVQRLLNKSGSMFGKCRFSEKSRSTSRESNPLIPSSSECHRVQVPEAVFYCGVADIYLPQPCKDCTHAKG